MKKFENKRQIIVFLCFNFYYFIFSHKTKIKLNGLAVFSHFLQPQKEWASRFIIATLTENK